MRHVNYSLKPATIDNAKSREKAYALTDGGGLQIEILPSGGKTWRFKYHLNGKREKVTIGAYPAFTIKQARDRHEELRALVARGQSPAKAKRAAATEQKLVEARRLTFRSFAQRWVDETLFYRSGGYVAQTVRWLDAYVYPAIGDMPLDEVLPRDVLAIIKARADTAVTAERIRVIVQQIYNHAIRNLLVTTNPAQPLRGAIARAPVEHHRHLSEKELAAFWRKLEDQGAHFTTISATRLLMLTMTRKSELLRSKWPEFDLDAAQWDIPAERMKMGKAHRVFLSRQAVDILRQVHEFTGHGQYVFPSIFRGSVPIGDVTLNHFFKRMDFGVSDFSPHGTRGTAATLLREHGFGRDVVELLLAHSEKNATVAAYSHMELAADRKRALQFLADRIEQLVAVGNVVTLRAA
ncbi:integrase arm-type DNA-binding domain-containing protein [Hydrogenophaga sp.]|uniref:tyrosine-type recombinase/integrase n=1 Tax=Hydrogenophaga sp. TaxID=1904254 RepID=UPI00262AC649|nr:integrase arm-type DNA-binding domain-containing protein [Hydrogenophaga sp.]MDM7950537.1 tyrosine-type recombinase/integrase [Hydrogenophaga sp.]